MQGYIKLYRQILDNPIVCKDGECFAIWCYLLLNATHTEYDTMFKGKRITLIPGQLITGRKSIAQKLKVDESKVQRFLKLLEIEQQIEQQKSNKNRLITIVNWSKYQENEQQTEQQVNNKRTTSEQQVNTNNNVKNIKNDNNVNNIIKNIVEYLNERTFSDYKYSTRKTQDLIKARLNEGFTIDDFKKVIDKKTIEWLKNDKMNKYLRPQTLFGTNFESYLNQPEKQITLKDINIDDIGGMYE